MPASTQFYGLSYFLFGDDLEDSINVDAERSRFVFLDKQIYGLYNIFGDGVISGWNISQNVENDKFTIIIESGYGFVDGQFAQTVENVYIENLMPNSTYYVVAKKDQNTDETNRDVVFSADTYLSNYSVFLGTITVGETGVLNIDTTDKTVISFLQLIKDEIAKHKHRGQPTKIDLQTEVKNQLSGARIKDMDTSKIVSGRFDVDRIPQLDHKDLNGGGLLSHAALDSFARLVTNGNQQLLGEIAAINTIKLITAQHYFAEDMNMQIGDVVEYPNLQLCIPGITSDSIIDFVASSAHINLESRCISGLDVKQGSINSVYYQTNQAYYASVDRNFVSIAKNSVQLIRGGSTAQEIESFKNVTTNGVTTPNFRKTVEIIEDTRTVDENGRFTGGITIRTKYAKDVNITNDWSGYDEILIDVKSLSTSHGSVYIYFINGTGSDEVKSTDFLLLNLNEVTDGPDSSVYGYVRKVFNISQLVRNNIRQMVIYTDDPSVNQIFYVGNIYLRSSTLYPSLGYIKFRHSSASPIVYNNINYEAEIPDGCDIRVRVKVANSASLLARAEYTLALKSGDVFALTGTDIEIEILLVASQDRTKTPTFKGMILQYLIDAVDSGFSIQNANAWNRGNFIGTVVAQDPISVGITNLKLSEPLSVGEYYYLYENGVNQITSDGVAKVGFRGLTLRNLLSPKQCIDIVYDSYVPGFNNPKSVYRLINKNYIVADTSNDRILEITPRGEFVRGIGSHTLVDANGFYPLNAVFNPNNGILTICFSQDVDLADFDLEKIKIWIGNSYVYLTSFDNLLQNGKPATLLEIQLTNEKIEQLATTQDECYVELTQGVFTDSFTFPAKSRKLLSPRGLRLFIGDFLYSTLVKKPIYANINKNSNWYICNSLITETAAVNVSLQTVIVAVGSTVTKKAKAETSTNPDILFTSWSTPEIPTKISSIVTTGTQTDDASVLEITITNPTEDLIGTYSINLIANYTNGSARTTLILRIIAAPDPNAPTEKIETPSLVEINMKDGSMVYENSLLYFSEFTLGSVFEIDENTLLISGLYSIDDENPVTEVEDPNETYAQQAMRKLVNSAGKTIITTKSTRSVSFEYFSPDKLYPSDAVIDNRGQVVVAESSFISNAGRVIKIDDSNNITWQVGYGLFNQVHDIRSKFNNDLIIST